MANNFKKFPACEFCGSTSLRDDDVDEQVVPGRFRKKFTCRKCSMSFTKTYAADSTGVR